MTNTVPYAPEARELSQEEYDAWAQQAFADQQEIKQGLAEARGGLWRAAEALYRFSENSGWLALGYETLGEWLADPDITMKRSTYFQLTQAWRELVVIRHVPGPNVRMLDLTKVTITLPALKAGKAQLEDVVADVETLGARDLREKYTGRVFGPNSLGISDPGSEPLGEETEEEEAVTPDAVLPPEEELYGPATISRGVAQTVTIALEAVMAAHPIERKSMSKELHSLGEQALEIAHAEGLGNV